MRPLLAILLLLLAVTRGAAAEEPADLVIRGAAVCTMDSARSWAEAVAVRGGRFVFVGDAAGVKPFIGPDTRVLDLEGGMVLPGFTDAHTHPVQSGIEARLCDLTSATTRAEVEKAIAAYAATHRDRPWIVGNGWALPLFPQANPSAKALDRLVPDRPAYITAVDGHSAWVNTKALHLAGITRKTPDPANGRIERDKHGNPTGTLRESAMALVAKLVPQPTADEAVEGLRHALKETARHGITSFQEANATEPRLEAYATLDRRGELTARVVAALSTEAEEDEAQVDRLAALRDRYPATARFRVTAAKIFADGVIEARTAAVLEPYTTGGRGDLIFPEPVLRRLIARLDREGFQVHVHAIGDRAVRATLDAFAAGARRDRRHHIAHLQLIHPQDVPRFRRLGVIANIQADWAQADAYVTELADPVLGPQRARRQYPFGSLKRSGAVIAAGSDWSVSTMDPLEAIQIAITRRAPDDPKGKPWLPDQKLDLMTMLEAYTINGAYLQGLEKETGSIEVGKAADLVALDKNLFEIPATDIHRARVILTLLEGKPIFTAPAPPPAR